MTGCPGSGTLQDLFEGLLAEGAAREVRAHVAGCARCAAEQARLDHVFRRLDALPLESPSPALAERVLDQVLPARRRIRWSHKLRTWYAGAVAGSLVGLAIAAMNPWISAKAIWLVAEASARVFGALVFIVNGVAFVVLSLVGGWNALSGIGARFAPIARALFAIADSQLIYILLTTAFVLSICVLWWMGPRPRRTGKGGPHVGVLGL